MPLEAFFGADLERALTHVSIPAYVIDTAGVIRWINDAGLRIVGPSNLDHRTNIKVQAKSAARAHRALRPPAPATGPTSLRA